MPLLHVAYPCSRNRSLTKRHSCSFG